jgi:hypothetical protein
MSRGPLVADKDCRETTRLAVSFLQIEALLTTTEVVYFHMASSTLAGFREAMGLAP